MAFFEMTSGGSYTFDAMGNVTGANLRFELEGYDTYSAASAAMLANAPLTVGGAVRRSFTLEEDEEEAGTWNGTFTYSNHT
jgi:hypothetical protein